MEFALFIRIPILAATKIIFNGDENNRDLKNFYDNMPLIFFWVNN